MMLTPECNHPKTAEDFLLRPSSSSPYKVASSSSASGVSPFGHKLLRDVKLKRIGLTGSSFRPTNNSRLNEHSENQNPNLSTPLNCQAKAMKEAIKSSAEKKQQPLEAPEEGNEVLIPKLKSTLSARNLFVGKYIMNQITDFCSELKRLATRAKEREQMENGMVSSIKEEELKKVGFDGGEENRSEKERMLLLELGKGKSEGKQRGTFLDVNKGKTERTLQEGKRIRKKVENAENIPVSLGLANVERKGGEELQQIRTNPPSPEGFSAARPPSKITPSKPLKSRIMEKEMHQGQTKKQVITNANSTEKAKSFCIDDGKEAKALDVFWFLKPCTLSTGRSTNTYSLPPFHFLQKKNIQLFLSFFYRNLSTFILYI